MSGAFSSSDEPRASVASEMEYSSGDDLARQLLHLKMSAADPRLILFHLTTPRKACTMLTTKAYVAGRHFGTRSNASRGHTHRAAAGQARGLDDRFAGMDVLPPFGYEAWGENELPSEFQAPEYESHHVVLDESEYINRLAEM